MSIFNSLGSNYTFGSALRSLKPYGRKAGEKLELQLAQDYEAESVYLTNKCREALALILAELDMPKGSKVAITGFTCYVVYEAVEAAGMIPELIDIKPGELNYSAEALEQAIKSNPGIKAAIVQNTLGIPCDIGGIEKVCKAHDIFLVEDLPHSAGMAYTDGRQAGTVGDAAGLSFGMNKIIDSVTGGAAIFKRPTNISAQFPKVSLWQRKGAYLYPLNTWLIRKTHKLIIGKIYLRMLKAVRLIPTPTDGYSGDIHGLSSHQAGLARDYTKILPSVIAHRRKIAEIYRRLLSESIQFKHFEESIYMRFPIRVTGRDALIRALKKHDIQLGIPWYDTVIAPAKCMTKVKYRSGQCPEGEAVASEIVNLPTHINISEARAEFIAEKVNEWLKSA